MKQINNGYLPCYWLDKNGQVYNKETGRYLKLGANNIYRLKRIDNTSKRVTLKSLYMLVYGKQFAIDDIKDLPNEVWKEIENTRAQYYISNKGRVKSYAGKKAIILKENTIKGYNRVDIMYNKQRSSVLVHRLVAQYFLPMPPNINYELHHKDGNRQNNDVSNLQWINKQEHRRIHNELRKKQKEKEINECA